MRSFSKIIVLAIAIVMALAIITACSQNTSATSSQPASQSSSEQPSAQQPQNQQETTSSANPQSEQEAILSENSQDQQVDVTSSQTPTTQASVNPDDYWVGENEYDLIGFMEAYGYHYKFDVKKFIKFVNDKDEYVDFKYKPDSIYIEIYLWYKDKVYMACNVLNNDVNDSEMIYFSGELQKYGSVGRTNFLRIINTVPRIKQNIEEGHCPFYGTNGTLLDHYEQPVGADGYTTGGATWHMLHSDNWTDKGDCY